MKLWSFIALLFCCSAQAQQPPAWAVTVDGRTGNTTLVNATAGPLTVSVTRVPGEVAATANVFRELCGGSLLGTAADVEPGGAVCLAPAQEPATYVVRGVPAAGEDTGVQAQRVTVGPVTPPVPSLAFVRDTDDVWDSAALPKACNVATGVTLTNINRPNAQVYACRTKEGVLTDFYPVASALPAEDVASASTASTPQVPRPVALALQAENAAPAPAAAPPPIAPRTRVLPGTYIAPGNAELKDLKLVVREPVWKAWGWLLAGVLISAVAGLLLTRWTATRQLAAAMAAEGLDPRRIGPLTAGHYHLATNQAEFGRYLTWWKFWWPTEHAERIARAVLVWREVEREAKHLENHLEAIKARQVDFEKSPNTFYFVIGILQRVHDGGANADKSPPWPLLHGRREVGLHEAGSFAQAIQGAAQLAEHLSTYNLPKERGTSPEAGKAYERLIRELDDPTDWQSLTAAEFRTYHAGLSKLRETLLNALAGERFSETDKVRMKELDEIVALGRTMALRPYRMKIPWFNPQTGLPEVLVDPPRARPAEHKTTLAKVRPHLLWNWAGVLTGALIAWLIGSVLGLKQEYFTGEPWGAVAMDYAQIFAYGAATLIGVTALIGLTKNLLPTAWRPGELRAADTDSG